MQEKKSPVTPSVAPPPEPFPQEDLSRESGIRVLFKSLLWFIVLPLVGMLALKWLVQI